jgi:hypothetical protein
MKSIKYIMAGLVAAGLTVSSYATITVNWASNGNTFLSDNTGAAGYLNGDLAEIGTFASAPTVGSPSLTGFSVFGTTLTSDGVIEGSTTATAGATFGHTQIYLVVFNAATSGAATQEGIFYESDSTDSTWKFPADADTVTSTSIDIQDMMVGGTGVVGPGGVVVYGATGIDPSGPYSLLETVPEPSSIALVTLGLFGALGMIRRRRS